MERVSITTYKQGITNIKNAIANQPVAGCKR